MATPKVGSNSTKASGVAAGSAASTLHGQITERFGIVPNFFKLAPDAPGIAPAFFGLAKFAYLDSPLPSAFKERLFVQLSRFCEVRYCLVRHFCFLVGRGNVAGDADCEPVTPADAIVLLRAHGAEPTNADEAFGYLRALPPLTGPIKPDSEAESAIFSVCTAIFLDPVKSQRYLPVLKRLFGPEHYEYLLLFIAFVSTANFWTELHPELSEEEDATELIGILEKMSWRLAWETKSGWTAMAKRIDGEIADLRTKARRAM
jgi:hypothetical protein